MMIMYVYFKYDTSAQVKLKTTVIKMNLACVEVVCSSIRGTGITDDISNCTAENHLGREHFSKDAHFFQLVHKITWDNHLKL